MKILLFVALICACLVHISLQQQQQHQQGENSEGKIQKLQEEIRLLFKYVTIPNEDLKEV